MTNWDQVFEIYLACIGKIYDKSKDCKLEPSVFRQIENELSLLSEYFKVSKTQAFLILSVFALIYNGDAVNLNDLIEYYDSNPMRILEYNDDFVCNPKKTTTTHFGIV